MLFGVTVGGQGKHAVHVRRKHEPSGFATFAEHWPDPGIQEGVQRAEPEVFRDFERLNFPITEVTKHLFMTTEISCLF